MWIGSNSKDFKVLNRLLVRDMIRRRGPIARYAIARETGLTASTVTVIAAELLEAGVIHEVGHAESSGGRRPILLELNARAAHALAIRVQRGELVVAVFDLARRILAERSYDLDTTAPEDVVSTIGVSFEELLQETKIARDSVLWCGVAHPGLISSSTGVLERSSNLGWVGVPVGDMITESIGNIPVVVENISNAAALAEKEYGLGRGHRHLVFINLSVGIGAGILANGEIYGGMQGYAGEVGHMTLLVDQGPICVCGQQGCFEAICSSRTVLERARSVIPEDILRQNGLVKEKLTMAHLASAPLASEPEVQSLVNEIGRHIGVVVANLISMLNPEIVILGGELALLGSRLLAVVEAEVEKRTLEEARRQVRVRISKMHDQAPLMGAYALALERIFALEDWRDPAYATPREGNQ